MSWTPRSAGKEVECATSEAQSSECIKYRCPEIVQMDFHFSGFDIWFLSVPHLEYLVLPVGSGILPDPVFTGLYSVPSFFVKTTTLFIILFIIQTIVRLQLFPSALRLCASVQDPPRRYAKC